MERLPLLVANLLNDLDALGSMLDDAVRAGSWLDAYLLAAGMNQVAEDRLHAAPYPLDEAASLWRGSGSRGTRHLAGAASALGRATRSLAGRRLGRAELHRWQRRLAAVVDDLAAVVLGARPAGHELAEGCRAIVDDIGALPRPVRRTVLRLPACFHGFDQRPEDFAQLAERYDQLVLDRRRALLVVGVRTSGSYLAPLMAALLRARGHTAARVITLRPRHALLTRERDLVSATAAAGGDVLLVDDPPVTGSSLARAAAMLERCGVEARRIVLVLALAHEEPPAALAGYRSVLLGPREWAVERWLRKDVVRATLASLLRGELEVLDIDPVELPASPSERGHRRARWLVRARDSQTGGARELEVLVSGVGLGYFGGQTLAVANRLDVFSPGVIGLRQGLLYRRWLAAERRVDRSGVSTAELAAGAARYVAARREALPVARDPTVALRGERPAWEVAGLILGDAYGRASPVARVAFVDALARRLLRVARPSVVDGATETRRWFTGDGAAEQLLKTGLTGRTHWRLGLACFDAAFDLAGVGALNPDERIAADVRRAWTQETGEHVPRERWLLYELVHLWGALRAQPDMEAEVGRAAARALQRYFAAVFLTGTEPPEGGALVALDIDGVLETELMGWPTLTQASATALRALVAHGYRPVPVSGRSLEEIRDRCRAYRLAGGIAEYGSVMYLTRTDQAIPLLESRAAAKLDQLRSALAEHGDIRLDPAYRHSVRAYRLEDPGRRSPLTEHEIASALGRARAAGSILAITGEGQTDFIASAIDKGRGLAALSAELCGQSPKVALAVGDSLPDGPMLAVAQTAFVPAHAPAEMAGRSVRRAGAPYQAGLALAVAHLLGHHPGKCPVCSAPRAGFERAAVVGLLSIAEAGRRGLLRRTGVLLGRLSITVVRG